MIKELNVSDLFAFAKDQVIPISVTIEVTHRCNEHCVHCYLGEHSSKGLTLEEYQNLFEHLAAAGPFFITFTGGEPFLRSDFIEIVRAARRRRFSVSILTNGTLIDQGLADELAALHVYDVHISIYGSNSTIHDQITRLPGSFEKCISAITMLLRRGILVKMKCPIMSLNAVDLDEMSMLAQKLGAQVAFNPVIVSKMDGDPSVAGLRASDEHILYYLDRYERVLTDSGPMSNPNGQNASPCDAVFSGGAIDPDGDVFVCNQLRIPLGNIRDSMFGDIWKDSTNARMLRDISLADLKSCNGCDLYQYCARCPGLALHEDGGLFECSSIARRLANLRETLGIIATQCVSPNTNEARPMRGCALIRHGRTGGAPDCPQ